MDDSQDKSDDLSLGGGDSSSESSSAGYEEMAASSSDESTKTICLFCSENFLSVDFALDHCIQVHKINFKEFIDKLKLDNYGYIKLINYIRKNKPSPKDLEKAEPEVWEGDAYLKAANSEDPWLWHDFGRETPNEPSPLKYVNSENGNVTMAQEHFNELQTKIQTLTDLVQQKDETITKMKELFDQPEPKVTKPFPTAELCDDMEYFTSYNNAAIHWEMVNDSVRTLSYFEAITCNKEVFDKNTVIDLGCGTGILSMMAVKAGAEHVYAIEEADILYHAMDIAHENGMGRKITFLKGKVEDIQLPVKEVDVLISEWMGYFLLYEGMLDSVILARDKFLKPDGLVLPTKCQLFLAGATDIERYRSRIECWDHVCGFKMSTMKRLMQREVEIDMIPDDYIFTNGALVKEFVMKTCHVEDTIFSSEFKLRATREGVLTHLVGYFDVFFELNDMVFFTTGPHGPVSHWKNCIFTMASPIVMKEGEIVNVKVTVTRKSDRVRALAIEIIIRDQKTWYTIT